MNEQKPILGCGVGLRSPHIDEILETQPDVPWFELLADNHRVQGGVIPAQVEMIRDHYPVTLHSVGLSLGSVDPLNRVYLEQLKLLAQRADATWISEHLCFTSIDGTFTHDLLPLPYTEESLRHVVDRIGRVQDFFQSRILVENVSSYIHFTDSQIPEDEFLCAVAEQADCWLLVDVNNIYVNQINHGLNGNEYIDRLPLERIREIHLAGYEDKGDYLLDTHNHAVSDPVWRLYKRLIRRRSDIPTLIEWDSDIPPFSILMDEAHKASAIVEEVGLENSCCN